MNQEQHDSAETSATLIITAQAEFLESALHELKRQEDRLEEVEVLAPGIALCKVPDLVSFRRNLAQMRPIFTRHIAPVQVTLRIHNTEADLGNLAIALAALPGFSLLERGQHFSVQCRLVQHEEGASKRAYSSGVINKMLAEAIVEETGAVEDIKHPALVVSLLCTQEQAYLGISLARDNLSNWPGGMRHFAQTKEQISRAEFKLLEALEIFGVTLPTQGRALDLGAAPGGWTRLLLEAGLHVVAVDPAKLDPRLRRPNLTHYRGYAESYLEDYEDQHQQFDVITNDMRMDAREAARLLIQMRSFLRRDGFIISTLKLPHATVNIDPLRNLREAISLVSRHFDIVQAKQLFHNRQEVTIIVARPRGKEM